MGVSLAKTRTRTSQTTYPDSNPDKCWDEKNKIYVTMSSDKMYKYPSHTPSTLLIDYWYYRKNQRSKLKNVNNFSTNYDTKDIDTHYSEIHNEPFNRNKQTFLKKATEEPDFEKEKYKDVTKEALAIKELSFSDCDPNDQKIVVMSGTDGMDGKITIIYAYTLHYLQQVCKKIGKEGKASDSIFCILTDQYGRILHHGTKIMVNKIALENEKINIVNQHGETALVRSYCKGRRLPKNGYLFTNLEPCNMCYNVIRACDDPEGKCNIVYFTEENPSVSQNKNLREKNIRLTDLVRTSSETLEATTVRNKPKNDTEKFVQYINIQYQTRLDESLKILESKIKELVALEVKRIGITTNVMEYIQNALKNCLFFAQKIDEIEDVRGLIGLLEYTQKLMAEQDSKEQAWDEYWRIRGADDI